MEVELISAAHPPALYQTCNGELQYINLRGDVLGMVERPTFESRRFPVCSGDRLFVYTDGLIEGYRDENKRSGRTLWGMQRLTEEMLGWRGRPLQQTVDGLVDGLLAECGGGACDDIVLLGIEF